MSRPSKPFLASYDSRCAECGDEIVGDVDEIVMQDGEAIHADCAVDDEPRLPTFPI